VDWAYPIGCPCHDKSSAGNADAVDQVHDVVKSMDGRLLGVETNLETTMCDVGEIKKYMRFSRIMFTSMFLIVLVTFLLVLVKYEQIKISLCVVCLCFRYLLVLRFAIWDVLRLIFLFPLFCLCFALLLLSAGVYCYLIRLPCTSYVFVVVITLLVHFFDIFSLLQK
jgi:hypothetical protein